MPPSRNLFVHPKTGEIYEVKAIKLAEFELTIKLLPNYKEVLQAVCDQYLNRFPAMTHIDIIEQTAQEFQQPKILLIGQERDEPFDIWQ